MTREEMSRAALELVDILGRDMEWRLQHGDDQHTAENQAERDRRFLLRQLVMVMGAWQARMEQRVDTAEEELRRLRG